MARAEGGEVPNLASPLRFGRTPVADPVPAPRLNEHFDAVLRGLLGYDAARVEALAAGGAFAERAKR